jgi:hypothetical protein
MVLAVFLLVFGMPLCGYGVLLATRSKRPLSLAGALLAATGLAFAMLGVGRLLSERLFSG